MLVANTFTGEHSLNSARRPRRASACSSCWDSNDEWLSAAWQEPQKAFQAGGLKVAGFQALGMICQLVWQRPAN